MELVQTLGFHHYFFFEIEIVDTLKPAQTRFAFGFSGDGL